MSLCRHEEVVPVENDRLGLLAWWCPMCEQQFDEDWTNPDRLKPNEVDVINIPGYRRTIRRTHP